MSNKNDKLSVAINLARRYSVQNENDLMQVREEFQFFGPIQTMYSLL